MRIVVAFKDASVKGSSGSQSLLCSFFNILPLVFTLLDANENGLDSVSWGLDIEQLWKGESLCLLDFFLPQKQKQARRTPPWPD